MKKLTGNRVEVALSPEVVDGVERIARASLSDPDEIINRILLNHVRSADVSPARGPGLPLWGIAEQPKPVERKKGRRRPDSTRQYLMRTPEMFERGLIKVGDRLRLKNHPGHEAYVHDGKNVTYRGVVMSYHAWGCEASQQKSICIYEHAVLDDGRLLEDVRPRK